ncbi:MAG TPA: sodium:solute symporter family protein [Methylomirabilota bacterium]|nr:sodium:solute symporter family protein [Methylomirabilota bacterium]
MSWGKIFGIYTGAFIGFTILLAILEYLRLIPNRGIAYTYLIVTIGVYALIGVLSRTAKPDQYYVAGRGVPAFFNGMATGADWMSAASFISMAGALYATGYDGLAYVSGWTGGYVLLAIYLAPFLRKFGAYTIPDFLALRYGGNTARVVGLLMAIGASFTYLIAQITGVGIIMGRFLGMDFNLGAFVGLAGILVCSMLGGMRAVTWTQVAQYIILILAYITPVAMLSVKHFGVPLPEFTYGQVLHDITAIESKLMAAGEIKKLWVDLTPGGTLNWFALCFCMMVGTAGLPHILMRYYTTPSVKEARDSVGWSLFFIFLLYFTAPAYAAFSKWTVLREVVGKKISELPAWVNRWGDNILGQPVNSLGLFDIVDKNGDGILQLGDFVIKSTDFVVLATPEIAGLPFVITGLVMAGGLAAALSTADGLLLTISNALSHDLYYKILNPNASIVKRLTTARLLLVVAAVAGAWVATFRINIIVAVVAYAFALAGSGFFPALVMGIFWKRANKQGAIAGMIAGFLTALILIVVGRNWAWYPLGVREVGAGVFGVPIGFIVIYFVSLMYPPPDRETQELVESVRYPKGTTLKLAGIE